jgi:hypothetical protein
MKPIERRIDPLPNRVVVTNSNVTAEADSHLTVYAK